MALLSRQLVSQFYSRLTGRVRRASGHPAETSHDGLVDRQRAADDQPTTANVNGLVLHLPARFRWHYVDQPFEPLSLDFALAHTPRGGVAIDVGAHIGFITLHLARAVGPEGRVVAVEPFHENASYIRQNAASNGFGNIEVILAAALAGDDEVELQLTESSDSHGIYSHPNTPTIGRITVPAITIDQLVTTVDFFKIDTEGAEIEALEGMSAVLRRSPTAAGLVEWTPACQRKAGRRPTELVEWIIDRDFDVAVIDEKAKSVMRVEEATDLYLHGHFSEGWYANLACTPRPSRKGG